MAQIINNDHNTILATGMYIELSNMWHKKLSSDKTWAGFKKFFAEEYHDLRELQQINATQEGFYGANKDIAIQDDTTKEL